MTGGVTERELDGLEMGVHLRVDGYGVSLQTRDLNSNAQVIVPWTIDPFLSSIVTVSLLSFIKNL